MTHSTYVDSLYMSSPQSRLKGETLLLVFIIIFGLLGLGMCFGLCSPDTSGINGNVSQLDISQEQLDNRR